MERVEKAREADKIAERKVRRVHVCVCERKREEVGLPLCVGMNRSSRGDLQRLKRQREEQADGGGAKAAPPKAPVVAAAAATTTKRKAKKARTETA